MRPYLYVKRALDIAGSGVLLLLLSPLLLMIAMLVMVTSGRPVLFRQRRLGRDARVFEMLKFRTMAVNAPDLRNADGTTFNAPTDARVTRIGRSLRRTSLDELPQLLNVLRGDMSLIGARPDLPEALAVYTPRQLERLRLRPGITGWAQVNGRNELGLQDRWEHDAWYAEHVSAALDVRIALMTLRSVGAGTGLHASAESLARRIGR